MPMVNGKSYSYTAQGKAAAKKAAANKKAIKKPADPKKTRTTSSGQLRQEAMRAEMRARNAGTKPATRVKKKK